MSNEVNTNAEMSRTHGGKLFDLLLFIAVIVALAFALHTIFSLRPRIIP